MARMRSLRPDFFLREDMADVSLEAHFLLAGLAVLADRDGRLFDRPRTIKAQVFPFRDVDLESLLADLVAARVITRYEVDGRRIIALLTWEDDQTPHPKETSLGLPPPPVRSHGTVTPPSHPSRKVVEASGRDPLGLGVGVGSRDGSGSGSLSVSAGLPPSADGNQATLVSVPASEPEKPKKRPTVPNAVSEWYESAKAKREAAVPSTAPDNSALRPDQWAKLGEALKLHGQKAMDAALAAFFADAYARDRHYPLGLFVGQCAKYQSEASAQQARGGARVGGETSDERAARLRAETWAKIQADKQVKAAGGGA